jgi:hypothetical protein
MKRIAERWSARRSPQARQARKARRRRRWDEAHAEADAYSRRHGPPTTEVYIRSFNGKR